MPPRRRKSTENLQRKQQEVKEEIKEISPQERRRQILLNLGVWFLILAFAMTSGIMCFSIGGQEERQAKEQQAAESDPAQAEIERWTDEVSKNPNDPVSLANLGYYWCQKAVSLPTAAEKKASEKTKANLDKEVGGDKDKAKADDKDKKPEVTREEALAKAREYLDRAVKADPNYLFALQKKAELEILEDKTEAARTLFRQIVAKCDEPLKVGPNEDKETLEASRKTNKAQALLSLAGLEVDSKNYQEAITDADASIKENPGSIEAYIVKSGAQKGLGDIEAAAASLDLAEKIAQSMNEPSQGMQIYVQKSNLYKEAGMKDKAVAELENARKLAQASGASEQLNGVIDTMIYQIDGKKKPAQKNMVKVNPGNATAPAGVPNAEAPAAAPATSSETVPVTTATSTAVPAAEAPAAATSATEPPSAPALPRSEAEKAPVQTIPAGQSSDQATPQP